VVVVLDVVFFDLVVFDVVVLVVVVLCVFLCFLWAFAAVDVVDVVVDDVPELVVARAACVAL
jgi:hypothetical protein